MGEWYSLFACVYGAVLVKEDKNRVRLSGLDCFFTRRYGIIVQYILEVTCEK